MNPTLYLYYRSGCSLCEAMHGELLACDGLPPYELQNVDIDNTPELAERYGSSVPVLTDASGEEICHYFLDLEALRAYFATH